MSLDQHRKSVRGLVPHEELKAPSVYVRVCVYLSGLDGGSGGSVVCRAWRGF